MALTTDYELVRASFLHRNPLPTLDIAVAELISEETRLDTKKSSHRSDVVLAVSSHSYQGRSFSIKTCKDYHKPGHFLSECPTIVCRTCQQKGHIFDNCSMKTSATRPYSLEYRYCHKTGHSRRKIFISATNHVHTTPENRESFVPKPQEAFALLQRVSLRIVSPCVTRTLQHLAREA
ncbi:hypothetical protein F0562_028384 [Nyssa sinensis]|uniref:CCHC-type domain-containing protein n=1 Tax=Nyssa sinensis TaxID=561372 RepID=A0A5J5B132_9ASTE|nr:hypothetical protein F0562_028384 [Nyssa sinensis]